YPNNLGTWTGFNGGPFDGPAHQLGANRGGVVTLAMITHGTPNTVILSEVVRGTGPTASPPGKHRGYRGTLSAGTPPSAPIRRPGRGLPERDGPGRRPQGDRMDEPEHRARRRLQPHHDAEQAGLLLERRQLQQVSDHHRGELQPSRRRQRGLPRRHRAVRQGF